MVNLRYHIVSLVAVFLALALGIVVGSTVVDRAIVDTLNDRVTSVENRANDTAAENRRLNDELDLARAFALQARDEMVAETLTDVAVLVVTVQGVDRQPTEDLLDALDAAGSVPAGTLVLTSKLLVATAADTQALAGAAGVPLALAENVRRLALERVASVLVGAGESPGLLTALATAGFLTFEPPPLTDLVTGPRTLPELASMAATGLRVVVVSGRGVAEQEALVLPLVVAVAQAQSTAPKLVVAAATRAEAGGIDLVRALREDGTLAARLSTVDNLDSPGGQAATVLALRDLAVPRTGHFGVGPGTQRQLPSG